MAVAVTIEGITKSFGDLRAVSDVSLRIGAGEVFFLLGPSGCGKTTLLRLLAGFHQPDHGVIMFGDKDVTGIAPNRRNTGMVFQGYALWPHMTIAENVAFGLKMRRLPRWLVRQKVENALALVHMEDRAGDKPNQLSGGQQQRVALARALVVEPQLLLLDEPLSNLDAGLRLEMREEIRRICKEAGLTAVYVTHDQKEALSIADRLAVMNHGKIEQKGTPREVYNSPANSFVAGFIGDANLIAGKVRETAAASVTVDTPVGLLEASPPRRQLNRGDEVTLCIRPEEIEIAPRGNSPNTLRGKLSGSSYLGEIMQYEIGLERSEGVDPLMIRVIEAGLISRDEVTRGATVACRFPAERLVVL